MLFRSLKDEASTYGEWPLPFFLYSIQVNEVCVPGYSQQLATFVPGAPSFTGNSKARQYYATSESETVDWLGRASPWHERYELTAPLCPVWLTAGDRMQVLLHSPLAPSAAEVAGLTLPTLTIVAGWMWPESADGNCNC